MFYGVPFFSQLESCLFWIAYFWSALECLSICWLCLEWWTKLRALSKYDKTWHFWTLLCKKIPKENFFPFPKADVVLYSTNDKIFCYSLICSTEMEQQGSEVQHSQVSSSKPGMLSGDSLESVLLQVSQKEANSLRRQLWTVVDGQYDGTSECPLGDLEKWHRILLQLIDCYYSNFSWAALV